MDLQLKLESQIVERDLKIKSNDLQFYMFGRLQ